MSYLDPDIQGAPVYPTGISMKNKKINSKRDFDPEIILDANSNIDIEIKTMIYIPIQFIAEFENTETFIYSTLISNDKFSPVYLSQLKGKFPLNKGQNMIYTFSIHVDGNVIKQYKVQSAVLQLSVINKHEGESGFEESLRVGRFFNTVFPIEEEQ